MPQKTKNKTRLNEATFEEVGAANIKSIERYRVF